MNGAAKELALKYEQLGLPTVQVTPVRGGLPFVMRKLETRSAVCPEPFAFRVPPALTVNGTPDIMLTMGFSSQPPRIAPPIPLCSHCCPFPNGRATTPVISTLFVLSKPANP